MESPQINVAVEELMFSLFTRPLHPELFKIYANRDFEARQTELHIHTFAAYPDQVTMIKTQSLFDFSTT